MKKRIEKVKPVAEALIAGGSYARVYEKLKHPHGPSLDMVAGGIKEVLETNHFDAAVILTHALADILDDHLFRWAEGRE
jgi:hypothetical protein